MSLFISAGKNIRLNKLACLDVSTGNTKALPLLQEGEKEGVYVCRIIIVTASQEMSKANCTYRESIWRGPAMEPVHQGEYL